MYLASAVFAAVAALAQFAVTPAAALEKLDAPTIACSSSLDDDTITLGVTAGASGAPGGFSIQWQQAAPDAARVVSCPAWPLSTDVCKASFSGQAAGSAYNLAAFASVDVTIGALNSGEPGVSFVDSAAGVLCGADTGLNPGTAYCFRAFAQAAKTATGNRKRSDFTADRPCSTR
ncbi:MAG: hypothetical protein HY535_06490 [Chloroflexi bacterium]|nr:hypothetical protein [Chloroflexota bacterium]